MDPKAFASSSAGRVVKTLSGDSAFEPAPLPPDFQWTNAVVAAVGRASAALGQLKGMGRKFPDPKRLVRMFLRKEAQASSQIERTYARVRTMLLFEHLPEIANAAPSVREVENNFHVLEEAFQIIRERPMTTADIRALHAVLFKNIEAAAHLHRAGVGRFRTAQNWIGSSNRIEEARYVPPPPTSVDALMQQLVVFISAKDALPPVVRAAMAHYQFEAIHPFEDGNGRIGRALVLAQLHREGAIDEPLLNPSAMLERNRRDYTDALLEVSRRGAWGEWIELFCLAIADEAEESLTKLNRLEELRDEYRRRVRAAGSAGRLLLLVDHLLAAPVATARETARLFEVTPAAGQKMLEKLESLKIVREITGKARNRIWLAHEYLAVFAPEDALNNE
jgi:Fic family protein